jgi:hypothetical protein
MSDRPAPIYAPSGAPVDRRIAPRAFDTPYGEGLYRRRIRLVNLAADRAAGELEDDFHHFRAEIRHDGATILAAEGTELRSPWSTCAFATEPLRAIEGHPIARSSTAIGRYAAARVNCTHLFDLAGLVVAHAARAQTERRYDIELTDPTGSRGTCRASMWRDGALVLEWAIAEGEIAGPAPWAGAPLRNGFIAWAEQRCDRDLAEAAIALRRIIDIARGRSADLDALDNAAAASDRMMGKCHTYSPATVDIAVRNRGSARHFAGHPELLLTDMEVRDRA